MLCLVLDELFESGLPRYCWALQRPIKVDAVEPIDAILRKRISNVGFSLHTHPISKCSLAGWNVAVAVLCLVFDELVESGLPRYF